MRVFIKLPSAQRGRKNSRKKFFGFSPLGSAKSRLDIARISDLGRGNAEGNSKISDLRAGKSPGGDRPISDHRDTHVGIHS